MGASAHGLFRATRGAGPLALETPACAEPLPLFGALPVQAQVARKRREREKDDFYPTLPQEPVRALLTSPEARRLQDFPMLWEPAAGAGAMVRQLEAAGLPVVGSDLVDRGGGFVISSFYDFAAPMAPAIITNPPFQECNWRDGKGRWIRHAIETLSVEYMALLLSWTWPGAAGLAALWTDWPPARVYLMRWKIDFTGEGSPPQLNAWFIWDREWQGETVLRMLDRDGGLQGALFGGGS